MEEVTIEVTRFDTTRNFFQKYLSPLVLADAENSKSHLLKDFFVKLSRDDTSDKTLLLTYLNYFFEFYLDPKTDLKIKTELNDSGLVSRIVTLSVLAFYPEDDHNRKQTLFSLQDKTDIALEKALLQADKTNENAATTLFPKFQRIIKTITDRAEDEKLTRDLCAILGTQRSAAASSYLAEPITEDESVLRLLGPNTADVPISKFIHSMREYGKRLEERKAPGSKIPGPIGNKVRKRVQLAPFGTFFDDLGQLTKNGQPCLIPMLECLISTLTCLCLPTNHDLLTKHAKGRNSVFIRELLTQAKNFGLSVENQKLVETKELSRLEVHEIRNCLNNFNLTITDILGELRKEFNNAHNYIYEYNPILGDLQLAALSPDIKNVIARENILNAVKAYFAAVMRHEEENDDRWFFFMQKVQQHCATQPYILSLLQQLPECPESTRQQIQALQARAEQAVAQPAAVDDEEESDEQQPTTPREIFKLGLANFERKGVQKLGNKSGALKKQFTDLCDAETDAPLFRALRLFYIEYITNPSKRAFVGRIIRLSAKAFLDKDDALALLLNDESIHDKSLTLPERTLYLEKFLCVIDQKIRDEKIVLPAPKTDALLEDIKKGKAKDESEGSRILKKFEDYATSTSKPGADYPPIAKLVAKFIASNQPERAIEALHHILNHQFSEKKTQESALLGAVILAIAPLILSADDLVVFNKIKLMNKQYKSYDLRERKTYLERIKIAVNAAYKKAGEPKMENFKAIFDICLNEDTDAKERKTLVETLEEWLINKNEAKFLEMAKTCGLIERTWLAGLPGLSEATSHAILTATTEKKKTGKDKVAEATAAVKKRSTALLSRLSRGKTPSEDSISTGSAAVVASSMVEVDSLLVKDESEFAPTPLVRQPTYVHQLEATSIFPLQLKTAFFTREQFIKELSELPDDFHLWKDLLASIAKMIKSRYVDEMSEDDKKKLAQPLLAALYALFSCCLIANNEKFLKLNSMEALIHLMGSVTLTEKNGNLFKMLEKESKEVWKITGVRKFYLAHFKNMFKPLIALDSNNMETLESVFQLVIDAPEQKLFETLFSYFLLLALPNERGLQESFAEKVSKLPEKYHKDFSALAPNEATQSKLIAKEVEIGVRERPIAPISEGFAQFAIHGGKGSATSSGTDTTKKGKEEAGNQKPLFSFLGKKNPGLNVDEEEPVAEEIGSISFSSSRSSSEG